VPSLATNVYGIACVRFHRSVNPTSLFNFVGFPGCIQVMRCIAIARYVFFLCRELPQLSSVAWRLQHYAAYSERLEVVHHAVQHAAGTTGTVVARRRAQDDSTSSSEVIFHYTRMFLRPGRHLGLGCRGHGHRSAEMLPPLVASRFQVGQPAVCSSTSCRSPDEPSALGTPSRQRRRICWCSFMAVFNCERPRPDPALRFEEYSALNFRCKLVALRAWKCSPLAAL
jgi:hypothetical protein